MGKRKEWGIVMTITVRDLAKVMCIDYTEIKTDGTCITDWNSKKLLVPKPDNEDKILHAVDVMKNGFPLRTLYEGFGFTGYEKCMEIMNNAESTETNHKKDEEYLEYYRVESEEFESEE